jgi:hypothetical protein
MTSPNQSLPRASLAVAFRMLLLLSFDAKPKKDAPLSKHHMEIPMEDEIVTFVEK